MVLPVALYSNCFLNRHMPKPNKLPPKAAIDKTDGISRHAGVRPISTFGRPVLRMRFLPSHLYNDTWIESCPYPNS